MGRRAYTNEFQKTVIKLGLRVIGKTAIHAVLAGHVTREITGIHFVKKVDHQSCKICNPFARRWVPDLYDVTRGFQVILMDSSGSIDNLCSSLYRLNVSPGADMIAALHKRPNRNIAKKYKTPVRKKRGGRFDLEL